MTLDKGPSTSPQQYSAKRKCEWARLHALRTGSRRSPFSFQNLRHHQAQAAAVLQYCFNPVGGKRYCSTVSAAGGHIPVVFRRTALRLCRAGTLTFLPPSLRFSESMVSCFRSPPASSSGVRTDITRHICHMWMEAMCLECPVYSCCTHTETVDDRGFGSPQRKFLFAELIAQRWRMMVTTSSSLFGAIIVVTSTSVASSEVQAGVQAKCCRHIPGWREEPLSRTCFPAHNQPRCAPHPTSTWNAFTEIRFAWSCTSFCGHTPSLNTFPCRS